ncbi:response regulator [Flavobacterium sp.]|uniref:response regulator n=1 Tax=Flavobacterium sp. TaxID=239 RepID=UPI0025F11D10|nr:response regulator [Flavobacterium sp.]
MLEKIYCVDDDVITLMLCKKVIERASFAKEILTATNGEEAILFFKELAEQSNPAYPRLVLLDLNMPIMNGWEFLDQYLKNGYQNIFTEAKFIVLSSTIDPQDVEKTKNYPMVVDFLSKPITKEMIENLKLKQT